MTKKANTKKMIREIINRRIQFYCTQSQMQTYFFIEKPEGFYLGYSTPYDFKPQKKAATIELNNDGSITLKGYATYSGTIATDEEDTHKLRYCEMVISYEEIKEHNFYEKFCAWREGFFF